MLAVAGEPTERFVADRDDTHLADIKIDGVRAVLHVDGGTVRITNRLGANITHRYPDISQAAAELANGRSFTLDGELTVITPDGGMSFPLIHRRDAQGGAVAIRLLARQHPATFVGFDLLARNGQDITDQPFARRRTAMNHLLLTGRQPRIVPVVAGPPTVLWPLVAEHNLEGLVLKQLTSRYRPGRQPTWVKVKPVRTVTCLVTGYTTSPKRAFRALTLALLDGAEQVPVGQVGSGFTDTELDRALNLHRQGDLLVDVTFQGLTSGGQLRFPVFRGFRTDLTVADATIDQLDKGRA